MMRLIVLSSLLLSCFAYADPDIRIKNLIFHQYNEQGKLTQTLRSKNIQHLATQKHYLLQKPFIQIMHPGQTKPITITAEKGIALSDGSEVKLQQHVTILQDGQLNTDEMTIFPKLKYAKTDSVIEIIHEKDRVNAKGMIALMEEQKVTFLKDIHAIFQPPKAAIVHASANQMIYQGKKSQISLLGNAKLTQDGNLFQAPQIKYDINKHKVLTKANHNQQTEIIIKDIDELKRSIDSDPIDS